MSETSSPQAAPAEGAASPRSDLRDQLARLLADENGLPPTAAALDVLETVITALQDRDLLWAEHSMPAAPTARVYAGDVVGELISEYIEGVGR